MLDLVSLLPSSQVTKVATLFNNIDYPFEPYHLHTPNHRLNGMKITHGNDIFYSIWLNKLFHSPVVNVTYELFHSPVVNITYAAYDSNGKSVNDSIANVTFDLSGGETQNLFLFFTNRIVVLDVNFSQDNNKTTFITMEYLDLHTRKTTTLRQICSLEKGLHVITSVQNTYKNLTEMRLKSQFQSEPSLSYPVILLLLFVMSVVIYRHIRRMLIIKKIFLGCLSITGWQNAKKRLTMKGVLYLSKLNGHKLGKIEKGKV